VYAHDVYYAQHATSQPLSGGPDDPSTHGVYANDSYNIYNVDDYYVQKQYIVHDQYPDAGPDPRTQPYYDPNYPPPDSEYGPLPPTQDEYNVSPLRNKYSPSPSHDEYGLPPSSGDYGPTPTYANYGPPEGPESYQNYAHDTSYYNGVPSSEYFPPPHHSSHYDPNFVTPIPPQRQYSIATKFSGQPRSNRASSQAEEDKPSYTPEAIEMYRQKAKSSNDPAKLLSFAKYLIEASAEAGESDFNPKAAQKAKDALINEAVKLLKRLATQGMGFGKPAYADAQFYLAQLYGHGSLNLQLDVDKAFNLYMQASKQNHAAATYRTAVCYEIGAGTKRDAHRAVQFYRKAAALGDVAAQYKLGMVLLNGLLAQHRNPREAVTWLKRAAANADEENPYALHELGLLHERENIQNEIPSIIHDKEFALDNFKRSADFGYDPSCFKLGQIYEGGLLGVQVNPQKSIYYYSKAAEKGNPEACLALSGWYLTGSEGVLKQSDTEAYLWARKAADMGFAKAEYAIGYYAENGIGVEQDLEEARRWYLRAASK
jgi:TPR repeat protein